MGSSIKNLLLTYLGIRMAGRLCPVRKDDTFIVSYPKSGNTWVRFLIGNLLYPDTISFENIEDVIPDIYQHSIYYFFNMNSPRILKSHENLDKRYRKIIYIVRDPRDVAVSYWHHKLKFRSIGEDYSMKEFINEFVLGKNTLYGTWAENVNSWLSARENKSVDILILRYEDLLISPENEVVKIISHLNLQNIPDDIVKKAIANSSFEKMGELENNQNKAWKPIKNTRQDMHFVRKGQAGAWKTELPPESAQQISESWKTLMNRLGYE